MRRNKFFCALVTAMKKVPIYGPGRGDPGLGEVGKPTYTVVIPDEEARKNMSLAKDEKEAKRLIHAAKAEAERKEAEELSKPFSTTTPSIPPIILEQPPTPGFASPASGATAQPGETPFSLFPSPSKSSATGRRKAGQGLSDLQAVTSRDDSEYAYSGRPSLDARPGGNISTSYTSPTMGSQHGRPPQRAGSGAQYASAVQPSAFQQQQAGQQFVAAQYQQQQLNQYQQQQDQQQQSQYTPQGQQSNNQRSQESEKQTPFDDPSDNQ